MSTVPSVIDPTLLVVNTIKDDGSLTRSDMSCIDRNLASKMSSCSQDILHANERAQYHNNIVEDARNRETRDAVNRNSDFILNDNRRNTDVGMNDNRRNADFGLNDNRRNTEFILSSVERNGSANQVATLNTGTNVLQTVERTSNATQVNVEKANASLGLAIDKNGSANLNTNERNSGIIRDFLEWFTHFKKVN